ncbi:MAG: M48 family metallopeptidase [Ilumatobacteraceae bacterium]
MDTPDFFELQRQARRRSALLLGGSFLILAVVANMLAIPFHLREQNCQVDSVGERSCDVAIGFTPIAAIIAIVVVALYMVVAYLASSRAALALAGAREATGDQYRQLRNVVEEMSIASGTPLPKVYVVDDPSPNAFATGRKPEKAAVTVTTGLLRQLSRRELKGVVAHELAHIRNRDISVTTIAVLTAGTIAVLADLAMRVAFITSISGRRGGGRNNSGGIAIVLFALAAALYLFALPAALLLRAALSRERESLADVSAVQYTRDPAGIRSALEKLEADGTSPQRVSTATAHMWIDEPKPAKRTQKRILSGLFDTHPPMGERIATLRRIEGIDPEGRGPNDLPPPPPPRPSVTVDGGSAPGPYG